MRAHLFVICFFFQLILSAQPYGNEWISFSSSANDYYRFRLKDRGVYRISAIELSGAGINLSQVNGANFQIYYRGAEIPLYTSTPGPLNSNDYIEFYADVNDGSLDSVLYKEKDWQVHRYKSIFSDSSCFFLTWNNQTLNERMQYVINDLTNLPAIESSYKHEEIIVYSSSYNPGKPFEVVTSSLPFNKSSFEEAEGYVGTSVNIGVQNLSVPFSFIDTGSIVPEFEMCVVGKSNNLVNPDHHVIISVGADTFDRVFDGYEILRLNKDLDPSALTSPGITVSVNPLGDLNTTDRLAVSYIKLTYDREFMFDQEKEFLFKVNGDSLNRKYFKITDFNDVNTASLLYDLTNKLRIETQAFNNVMDVALPISENERTLFMTSEGNVKSVSGFKKIEFLNFYDVNNQGDYVFITHPSLQDSSSGTNWVKAYADYRDQSGYTTRVINAEQLTDQFGFGDLYSPLGINKLVKFALDQWFYELKGIFIIGQGLTYNANSSDNLVPTFGNVPSDNMLTASLEDFDYRPRVPIGRLSASTPEDVRVYLNKVIDHEQNSGLAQTIADKAWMKQVLHFGGGSSNSEQIQFEGFLNNYESILEDTLFGGNVTTFLKNSSNPIQIAYSSLFDSLFHSGVSLMTFFGHSSTNSFDFSVDVPENYHNKGKYPLVVSNGCYSGYLFTLGPTISKRFVIQEDKGSIGFLAANGLSYSTYDHAYTSEFIKNMAQDKYGEPVGEIIRSTINNLYDTTNQFIEYTTQTFTLHGEPMVRLNNHSLPDYLVDDSEMFFEPSYVTVNEDTFYMNLVIYNIGRAIDDSVFLRVERKFPDGTLINAFEELIKAPYYKDTLRIAIETRPDKALGINQFNVYVDPLDQPQDIQIDETDDVINNQFSVELIILSDDVLPVYPYEFSIVDESGPVELKASTVNVFSPLRRILMEIDTSELFSSPIKRDTLIEQTGGIVRWAPPIDLLDSSVYYWRVSLDTLYGSSNYNWNTSSFIYWPGKGKGWNQSHFYQFQKNEYANVDIDKHTEFEFVGDVKDVMLYDYNWAYYPSAVPGAKDVGYYVNGVYMQSNACLYHYWPRGGLMFAVFDSSTALPLTSPYNGSATGLYGNFQCKPETFNAFIFFDSVKYNGLATKAWREKIIAFIDTIPDSMYVLAFIMPGSAGPFPENWDNDLYLAFESLGSSMIRQVPNRVAWGLFTKKGDLLYNKTEERGDTVTDLVSFNASISGSWTEGYWYSKPIGPATNWKHIFWDHHPADALGEEYSLDVIAIDRFGVENLIINDLSVKDTSLEHIIARDYPYLKLKVNTKDDSVRTPLQLKNWRILFDPLPEASLNPSGKLEFYNDTIIEGDTLSFSSMIENISDVDMDSILVSYFILNDKYGMIALASSRIDSLKANDTLNISLTHPTLGISGENRLLIKVNPGYDQPELTLFNNNGLISFYVKKDELNPLLDVSFDGVHILDGDIVSSEPEILIRLDDENRYLAMDDTSLLNIFIVLPDGKMVKQSFDGHGMLFIPADSDIKDRNRAEVYLYPELLMDGVYKLIVQGKDRTGNASGAYDYIISFEVVNESTVTNVINYPNPFTSQTQFVFTLTGSVTPDYFKIQIMNIGGKVVKEVSLSELGPIHIGRNITEYAWDGRDEYGDLLANGVYLYRFIIRKNGQVLKHRSNESDKFFKSGLGKMVLIR
ncbi:MAG TPA: hypothetical protein EYQ86_01620 [Bacteroidetes bacterium]|nr:hypothetical protein [Bacteroidota bacterium]